MHCDNYRGFNGYLLEKCGRRIVFSGDTAKTESFQFASYGLFDLAIMGIGCTTRGFKPTVIRSKRWKWPVALTRNSSCRYTIKLSGLASNHSENQSNVSGWLCRRHQNALL